MQLGLMHERIEDAIDEVFRAAGGRKKVAALLWPDKPARDAHNLIDACLNPERREKFAPSQLVLIVQMGRQYGCHAVMNFIAQASGYEARPVSPEARRDRLLDVVETAASTLKNALDQLEEFKPSAANQSAGAIYSFGQRREA